MTNLIVLKGIKHDCQVNPSAIIITFDEFKNLFVKGSFFSYFFSYKHIDFYSYNNAFLSYPLATSIMLRLLSRRNVYLRDAQGAEIKVKPPFILRQLYRMLRDLMVRQKTLSRFEENVHKLTAINRRTANSVIYEHQAVYLRTDLWFGLKSGGSIGHIAGVLNNLDSFTGSPLFLTTDYIPTVREDICLHLLKPTDRFWDFSELPSIASNESFEQQALSIIGDNAPSFIYQRYSANNYLGVSLTRQYNVPFILEYNGSEVWIARNWGKPLKYETLSEKIELLNLHSADVIVVVSQPMKDELVARGIEAGKILVNPNGVDPDRYSPDIDGAQIRNKYSLTEKVVIGFIGTFGPWHGAEVLAEAFGMLLQDYPEYGKKAHLLMIGDGPTMSQVKENLAKYNVSAISSLAGLIPQEDGPTHLAACDILASPHVPNPDGTPFFGSPTKLFEYMAMGKGIVASDLDQVGEILDHDRTAWMVKPGDTESLMLGLKTLIDDAALRTRLGMAARQVVIEKCTWKEHTRRIIEKLKERCGVES